MERDTLNVRLVPAQGEHLPAGRGIPETHRSVATDRGQPPTIWAEAHPPDLGVVSAALQNLPAGYHIPNPHGSVAACGGDLPAVWTVGRLGEFVFLNRQR